MNEINAKKIENLMNNADFKERLAEASAPEAAREILAQYGVELSMDEIMDMIKEEVQELSTADLDNVAGGHNGFRHIVGYKIVWGPIGIFRGKIIYGPILVPVYCRK